MGRFDVRQIFRRLIEPFSPGFVLRIVSGFVPECDDDEGGGHDRGDGGGARGRLVAEP